MFQIKIILISGLFVTNLVGQDFLYTENENSPVELYKKESNQNKKKKSKDDQKFKNIININYFATSYNFKLTSKSNNQINFTTLGHKLQIGHFYRKSKRTAFSTNVSLLKYNFDDLSSLIVPNHVSGTNFELNAFYHFIFSSLVLKNPYRYQLKLGVRFLKEDIDPTVPVQIASSSSVAVGLGFHKLFSLSENYDWQLNLTAFPYKQLKEKNKQTGNYKISLDGSFESVLFYKVGKSSRINFSYALTYINNRYEGIGSRGFLDTETYQTQHSLGFGLVYDI